MIIANSFKWQMVCIPTSSQKFIPYPALRICLGELVKFHSYHARILCWILPFSWIRRAARGRTMQCGHYNISKTILIIILLWYCGLKLLNVLWNASSHWAWKTFLRPFILTEEQQVKVWDNTCLYNFTVAINTMLWYYAFLNRYTHFRLNHLLDDDVIYTMLPAEMYLS